MELRERNQTVSTESLHKPSRCETLSRTPRFKKAIYAFFFGVCGVVCILMIVLVSSADGSDLKFGPTVAIDCGQVRGISLSTTGPYSFRGIPYASPPNGNLRWRPPKATTQVNKNCWEGTLEATTFGSRCYQRRRDDTSKHIGNEDCLYLNVWTPTLNQSAQLPVIVWLHGGYLCTGNANEDHFSPTEDLAKETNTVYVSFNYRLHAFGFMTLKWLADDSTTQTSGNYGFMDMIVALQWIQRNIEQFGGSKNQVCFITRRTVTIISILSFCRRFRRGVLFTL